MRFINTPKQTNTQWAINLIDEQPIIKVKTRVTHCDGGNGPLGHPRVYINVVSCSVLSIISRVKVVIYMY